MSKSSSSKSAKNSNNIQKNSTKSSKKQQNSSKNTENNIQKLQKNASLDVQIASNFDEENKVEQVKLELQNGTVTLFYIDSLIDKALFSQGIMSPLEKLASQSGSQNQSGQNKQNTKTQKQNKGQKSFSSGQSSEKGDGKDNLIKQIKLQTVSISGVVETSDVAECLSYILSGFVVLVAESKALCYPIFGVEKRSVEEPPTSRVVKGPREGFVEDLPTNIGLVRKRLKTPALKIVDMFVGKKTNTHVSLVYLDKVAKPEVVEQVKRRIKDINIDAIIDSYYIESFLEEDKLKFFRRVGDTEKPDVFCAKVLEGRVGILVDGSPIALTVPFMLFEDLQTPGDYYSIPSMATFARLMRIVGLITAILAPGIYVSLQSYNYRILPINFLIALLSSIEGLSIPPLVELLFVLLLFEVITEASLQMPSALGMALSIIGALALGSTAVDAGLLSAPSIVIVAISSVTLYIIPDQINETRLLRLLMTVVGGVIGLYGIVTAFMILTTYLTSMTSFGVPYMAPLAPSIKSDKKDAFIKQAIQSMDTRPELIAGEDKIRQMSSSGKNDDMKLSNAEKGSGCEDQVNDTQNQEIQNQESQNQENQNQKQTGKAKGRKKSLGKEEQNGHV